MLTVGKFNPLKLLDLISSMQNRASPTTIWHAILLPMPLSPILAWYPCTPILAPLALPALALWYSYLLSCTISVRWRVSVCFAFLTTALASYWLTECLVAFVGLSFVTSLFAMLPIFLLSALLFSTPLILGMQNNVPGSVALWVTLFEYVRQDTFMATPWLWHATIALETPFLHAIVPFGGHFMATYLVCLLAWLIALSLQDCRLSYAGTVMALFLFCFSLELTRLHQDSASSTTIPIHIIQGNVPTAIKRDADATWKIYSNLLTQSSDVDGLHLLPEGVLSYAAEDVSDLTQFHQPGILKNSIIGTNLWVSQFSPSLITTGKVRGLYHKHRLVPFGESNPFSFLFPQSLKDRYPFLGTSKALTSSNVLSFDETLVYPFLCYELFFSPTDKRQLAKSELLVASAENTWYGNSAINDYFLMAARFRALESGKSLALALNRGPSAIIDSSGHIIQQLSYDEQGVLSAGIATKSGRTLYHVLPDSVILLSLIVLDILLFLGLQHGHFRYVLRSKHRTTSTNLLGR